MKARLSRVNAKTFRRLINLWPPLLGAGISVRHVAPDFRKIEVCLRQRPWNSNPSGAHFGGSLFAMTDPFYALMLAHGLGRGYVIWDKYASIDFRRPGIGTVTAHFELDEATIEEVRASALDGEKVLKDFTVEIRDAGGLVVATVEKTVYVRKRRSKDAAA